MLTEYFTPKHLTMTIKPVAELVSEARQGIDNLSPEQAAQEIHTHEVLLVDVREPFELEKEGKIQGSVHAIRGGLELFADPACPFYNPAFHPAKRIIVYCAGGSRSALSAQTLKQMGYPDVAHIDGGLIAWKQKGLPVTNES
jgi:rhodanese-related sulfurtransferase